MFRRHLLQGVGTLALLSIAPARALAKHAINYLARSRVRPGDPAWPSAAAWQKLNAAVGGNLIKVEPLFAPCAADAKSAACADVLKNIHNPFYLGDQPGGTQVSGWLDAWMPEPSAYAIHARNAADVAAGVNFAREHNLRLVVKGAGHSYLGTSNAPDSLLIWTRGMNKIELHDAFVGQSCDPASSAKAVTTESGAVWIDLYHAVTAEAGRYVQGGGCADVGVAGLVQSGGFGSCSKGYGTAAANLLEAEIVTADGKIRIANACTNPDLFWAIKGGGGGSWGVVTKLTLRTHDLPEYFGYCGGKITAQSDAAFRALIARFVAHYADNLFNPHWGESVKINQDNTLELSMVCQGLDSDQASAAWQPFFDWVKAQQALTVDGRLHVGVGKARHWWDIEGNDAMIPDKRPGAPSYHGWWQGDQDQVSAFLHGYELLWLPSSLLATDQQQRLADALFAASRHFQVQLHFNKGLAGAPADAIARSRDTATNPAVLDAFVLAIIATGGPPPPIPGVSLPPFDDAAAHANARAVDAANAELLKVAPEGGSYVSESNFFNPNWCRAYWGANYPKLRAIKTKYDPADLFFVHHGVGSEEWSDDGFTRLAKH